MNRLRLAIDHGGLMASVVLDERPIARSRDGNFPLLNVRVGSFAIDAAGLVYRLMSVSGRERPASGVAAK